MKELYAITVSTFEAFEDMKKHRDDARNSKSGKICDCEGLVAVHPNPAGRFIEYLFETPLKRNEAYKVAYTLFETAAIKLEPAYVDEKYLMQY